MIKKILKYTKNLTLLSLGLVGIYLFNLFFMKPYSIDHFLGKELVIGLVDSPEAMTYIGIFDRFNWLTGHNSNLSIPKKDDRENSIEQYEHVIKTLYKYEDSSLTEVQKNTKKIAILRYCEFSKIQNGKITEVAMFFDIPHLMLQAFQLSSC